jgi:hypothetical protein
VIGNAQDPILKQAEAAISAKVPPPLQSAYQRIVLAGQKMLYSPQMHDRVVKQLQSVPNPAQAAGEGVAKLMALLIAQSKGTMMSAQAMPAVSLAAATLVCEALDFMEKMGIAQVTPQLLSDATQFMGTALLQVMGITPEKLAGAAKLAHKVSLHKQSGGVQRTLNQPAPGGTAAPAASPAPAPTGIIGRALGGAQ